MAKKTGRRRQEAPQQPATFGGPLADYSDGLFGYLQRADQRRWAEAYLRGLLATPGKKSLRRMAETVSASPTAAQSLRQFLNASPWDWAPARHEVIRRVGRALPVRAWSVDTVFMPKRGDHSVGVHRTFVPVAGRAFNCQQGVGIFLATDRGSVAADWRLVLPPDWTDDPARRRQARIPDAAEPQSAGDCALDLVLSLAAQVSHPLPPIVVDLPGSSDTLTALRGLGARDQKFVLAVPAGLHVEPVAPSADCGWRPEQPGLTTLPVGELLRRTGRRRLHAAFEHRHGLPVRSVRVASSTARLAGPGPCFPDNGQPVLRFFVTHLPTSPGRIWATNALHCRVDALLDLVRLQPGAADSIRMMSDEHGLLDFEGRSFPGWHHHMTLVSAAHAYRRLGPASSEA
ncbi:transposase [Streptomyces sp. SID1328]|uniref:IS701 family transposase n=1 Tax=Streptomyces sp. SID1328 TaxID=2690250 RepID=UPI00136B2EE2|nr:transposase [Streptomyces sp. SID1328]MYV39588.1 transposase [Streptomyces sp. SID1328]